MSKKDDVSYIINKVATDEVDIVGESVTEIIISNEFRSKDKRVELTEDDGGYDLSSSELVIQILTLMVSFATFGLELYDRIQERSRTKRKVEAQEQEIKALREEIIKNKEQFSLLMINKQIEICEEIIKIKRNETE